MEMPKSLIKKKIIKQVAEKLQGTAYDKRCPRRIYKRSDQPKKKNNNKQTKMKI